MAKKPAPLTSFDHTGLDPENTAIFLDFDGTLADFAEHPDAVSVPMPTREVLARLQGSTRGALAIVTGRPIADIDRFLAPLNLPVAGVHGLERRTAAGERIAAEVDAETLALLKQRFKAFADAHPGTLVESKPGSAALHYRQRPELAEASAAAVSEALKGLEDLEVLHGKMVIEVKSGRLTKADAIAAFMDEPPFRGRLPLFAGDDRTDEDAFHALARSHGISIKIGGGDTVASFRAEGIDAFRNWLGLLADSFDSRQLTT